MTTSLTVLPNIRLKLSGARVPSTAVNRSRLVTIRRSMTSPEAQLPLPPN